jgi:RHS repeat-associated protein
VKLTDWDAQITTYTYDLMGRLKTVARSNGILSTYTYDRNGRLLTLQHSKSGTTLKRFAYTLDARGNRTQLQELSPLGGGSQIWTQSSPQIQYFAGAWSVNGSFKLSADYYAAMSFAFFGKTFTLTLGNGPDHGMCDIYVDGFMWGSRDLYSPSASEESFSITCYEETAHVIEIRNRVDKNLASSGRKLSFKQVEILNGYEAKTEQYTYDALSRLSSSKRYTTLDLAATPAEHHLFEYDKASNRTRSALYLNGVVSYDRAYSYNGANQLTNAGFTYDANGNMTHDGVNPYTWDRANRLLSHQGSSYTYNGLGQRVSQTVGSIVTQYLQDTQPGLFKVIKSTTPSTTARFVHDVVGVLAQEDSSGNWDWVVKDGLGSVRGVYNNAGTELEQRRYAPYGTVQEQTGTQQMDYGYTGEWEDQNELVYLRARYYDPALGVWTNLDPLALSNRYSYITGNPVNFIDPTGLIGELPNRFARNNSNTDPANRVNFCLEICSNYQGEISDCFSPCATEAVPFCNTMALPLVSNTCLNAEAFLGCFEADMPRYRAAYAGTSEACSPSLATINNSSCPLISPPNDKGRFEPLYDPGELACRNPLKLMWNTNKLGNAIPNISLNLLTGQGLFPEIESFGFVLSGQAVFTFFRTVALLGGRSVAVLFNRDISECRVMGTAEFGVGAALTTPVSGSISAGLIVSTGTLDELVGRSFNLSLSGEMLGRFALGLSVLDVPDCDVATMVSIGIAGVGAKLAGTSSFTCDVGSCQSLYDMFMSILN